MSPDEITAGVSRNAPEAKVKRKGGFSLIWLIPIVAAIAGAWLVYTTFASRGPLITITFPDASGIEPGKTQIKYRDVQLGLVQTVKLNDDATQVIVTARINKEAEDQLHAETKFWIESARITTSGVSGLGTLLSGVYIGMRPGDGEPERHFQGLETPPLYQVTVPGKNLILKADRLGSISAGAPIFFRGIQVGGVLGYQMAEDGNSVTVYAFVRAPYDSLIREGTEFWNASGIDVSLNASGVSVRTESLTSVLIGGVAFDTPSVAAETSPAEDGATFHLYNSYEAIAQAKYTVRIPFVVYFDGSVSGLDVGAPVLCLGMKLGEVTAIRLEVDPGTVAVKIPVTIALEPQRWLPPEELETVTPARIEERMRRWIDKGLRAQLQSGNLLTGQKVVALEVFPDAPPASLTYSRGLPEVPTVPSEMDALTAKVTAFLNKLDKAPIDELVADARDTVKQAGKTLASPGLQKGMDGLKDVGPLLDSLTRTSNAANTTLLDAQATVQSLNSILGPDAPIRYDLNRMLKELTNAARSMRVLADFLERNPNALLLGKPLPEKP
jgi:Paraquat-inducible protein B